LPRYARNDIRKKLKRDSIACSKSAERFSKLGNGNRRKKNLKKLKKILKNPLKTLYFFIEIKYNSLTLVE
jgi:hypothetical protein